MACHASTGRGLPVYTDSNAKIEVLSLSIDQELTFLRGGTNGR